MKLTVRKKAALILGIASLLSLAGCSSHEAAPWDPEGEAGRKKVFKIATRQLAPEPVYNRLRWVRPSQVLPERDLDALHVSHAPLILPVVRFEVDKASLKEAALVLAATARYRSYCASTIAEKPLTLTSLGTIDELAEQISHTADIRVVVDHDNREVRFLENKAVTPEFISQGSEQ